MSTQTIGARLENVRRRMQEDHDPRLLHDEMRGLVDDMHRRNLEVPRDVKEALGELEAEILETFYDNLPV